MPRKTCLLKIRIGERGPGEWKNLFITVRISDKYIVEFILNTWKSIPETTSASCHAERVCLLPLAAHYSPKSWWWLQPTRLLCPWYFPGKNTGVGYHALLHGIFPTQGLNLSVLHLLHWQAGSLPLVPPGKPILSRIVNYYYNDNYYFKSDIVKNREAWHATVCGLGVWHNWVTKQQL